MLTLRNGYGDLIPEDDPAFAEKERKKMTIVIKDSGNRQIIVKTKEAIIGERIVFLRSSCFCRKENRYEEGIFGVVFSAINEVDLILLSEGPKGCFYSWVNPPKYFLEDEGVGNILTFVEI